ncbi:general transcription factor II-I repeat domain-containing protein 2-like [Aplochiton taeniatus]
MAKRKVDDENRGFQARWEAEYMFTEVKGKPVCLLCGESVAVMKEYNLRRHYETSKKHKDKDKKMDTEQRLQKVEELKRGLKCRQALLTTAKSQSTAAVKASFIVAEEVAKSARPFTEGEFIKNCMFKACDTVCPDKRQLFANVSLSRNTVAERVDQLSTNLKEQLMEKGKYLIAYSLAVDESTDTTDIAQLSIFIRGVDSSLSITEEFLSLCPMHGTTTGQDLYEEVSRCVNEMGLPWEKLTFSMFGSTYLCEQIFSLMKLNKTSHRSRLTDKHLDSVLRISSAQSLTPNIDELVQKMRHHQVSGSVSDK